MNPISIPILAIVGAFSVALYHMYLKHKALAFESEGLSKDKEQLQAELAALKERVEVLEKIVTDKNYDLKDKINNL